MGSQREPIRNSDQPGVVPLDVVHLRDLRRGAPEQIGHLFRREAGQRSVRALWVESFESVSLSHSAKIVSRGRNAVGGGIILFLRLTFCCLLLHRRTVFPLLLCSALRRRF